MHQLVWRFVCLDLVSTTSAFGSFIRKQSMNGIEWHRTVEILFFVESWLAATFLSFSCIKRVWSGLDQM